MNSIVAKTQNITIIPKRLGTTLSTILAS